jgi:predicted lipid-binding transport protein (Tim44 family)
MWTCTTSALAWSRCTWASSAERTGFLAVVILASRRVQDGGRACRRAASGAACVALLLALGGHHSANAATLGNVVTSLGFFVALAALLVSQVLPLPGSVNALPMLAFALLAGAAAAALMLWRMRGAGSFAASLAASFAATVLSFAPRAVRVPAAQRPVAAPPVALPDGFDREQLLADLRRQYVRLQAAWDARDADVLRALTTPEMLAELCAQFPETHGEPNFTEVVTLHATLLGFDELASATLASVEFSGTVRESAGGGALPFRELWMLVRPKREGAEWQLARQLELP